MKSLPVFLGIIIGMGIVGDWWWGLAFWLLPYLTWFQFVLRLRNIAEHGATEVSENQLQNTRTTMAGPIERVFIAPYWVNYHLEHHLVMHVPCWRLKQMHALLREKGLTKQMRMSQSYWHALVEAGWKTAG